MMDMSMDMQMDKPMVMSHGQSYFSWSTSSHALLECWTTASVKGLVLATATGLVMSVSLEGLKCYSFTHKLAQRLLQSSFTSLPVVKRLVMTLLHTLDVSMGYILMLLIMTFNLYVTLAVVVGAGLGHFVLRPVFLRRVTAMAKRRLCAVRILNPWHGEIEDGCDGCGSEVKDARNEGKDEGKKSDGRVEIGNGGDASDAVRAEGSFPGNTNDDVGVGGSFPGDINDGERVDGSLPGDTNDAARVEGSFPYCAANQEEDEELVSNPLLQCRQYRVRGKETSV